jgi:trigger factor
MAEFGIDEGGVEAFRNAVRENMEREAAERIDGEVREQVLAALVAENPIDLPRVLVDREVEQLQSDAMRHMGGGDKASLPPREPFVAEAEKRVALGLIMGEVIASKKLAAPREQVDARIQMIAAGQADSAAAASQIRADQNLMHRVEMMVLEEEAIKALVADADVKNEKVSFEELMELDQ